MSQTTERTLQVTWEDPMSGAAAARTMTGIEYLNAMKAGKLPPPPIVVLMGFTLESIEEGKVVFGAVPAEQHYNPIGSIHGGFYATLLDSAVGCAVQSQLPAGVGYTSLELHVNFIRAANRDTGPLRCTGTVIHMGGRVATASGEVRDLAGKLYAHCTTTCMILR